MRRAYDEALQEPTASNDACSTCGVASANDTYPNGHAVGCPEAIALHPEFAAAMKEVFRQRKLVTRDVLISHCRETIHATDAACERFVDRAIERGVITENEEGVCFLA